MLYVVGGRAKPNAAMLPAEHLFERGVILAVDPEHRRAETVFDYVSPPCHCPDYEPSILFKASTLGEDTLYVCTTTEILLLSFPDLSLRKVVSLPCFNDVHHVTRSPGDTLFVAVTGLDMVIEMSEDGHVHQEWSTTAADTWTRFSRNVDYRKVASTKPHQSHPNFIFFVDSDPWVTRLYQKDAVCLTRPEERVYLGIEKPHDGIVWNNRIFFTTVDGHIIVADCENPAATQIYSIRNLAGDHRPLGWCRALCVLDDDEIVVGFSRIRRTRHWENLAWAMERIAPVSRMAQRVSISGRTPRNLSLMPTRLCCINLKASKILWEFNLEVYGMNAIFSILHDD